MAQARKFIVYGDFNCPFCYALNERLHAHNRSATISWASVQHIPGIDSLLALDGWRVFLCGYPPMVHGAKKLAYLAGAALEDILTDPFELRELRQMPRD